MTVWAFIFSPMAWAVDGAIVKGVGKRLVTALEFIRGDLRLIAKNSPFHRGGE